jgi:DNA processing protein
MSASEADEAHDPDGSALEAWVRLASIPGISSTSQRKLLATFGEPAAALQASTNDVAAVLGQRALQAWRNGPDAALVDHALNWLQAAGNRLVTLADAAYPPALLNTPDPPPVLYAKGRPELLQRRSIAIVGARSATPGGMRDAEAFAEALGHAGLTIVSGLANGIDTAAHRGGLQTEASSIAVVATGLDKVYPARNRDLAHRLAEQGLLLSEFPLGTPPLAANFPRRNRVISGLAAGTLVVEAALHSGSLITARQALEQGREVFAIPGSIHSPLSKGCHWLIKQGAKLVESASDVLEELGIICPAPLPSRGPLPALPEDEANLLEAMGYAPVDIDSLCEQVNTPVGIISTLLLKLELGGHISRLPGGLFQRLG